MNPMEAMQSHVQDCVGKLPVIVLGSGASAAHGIPGMDPLGKHLAASNLPTTCQADPHLTGWKEFLEKVQKMDLESALTEVNVTPEVLGHIVNTTWKFLNAADFGIFEQVLADRRLLPLGLLFQHLLRSTATELQVVTPNYDRLAEYAAEAAGYCAYTGFTFGMFGARAVDVPQIHIGRRRARTVNVWKVHGSLGWFSGKDGSIVSLPPLGAVPGGFTPVIVTPGTEKYRRTHDEPFRTAMHSADVAVARASAFLCIGYGFNDDHLQPLMMERCTRPEVPLVLITKAISPTAHRFLKSGRCSRYVALEESPKGTRMFSHEVPDGVELVGQSFWRLDRFLSLVTE
ncbi:SIR2 family protein [Variovorax sp. J22R24]|uniref:SIR2 family protein n=1 Tax=Variovorax gracilis TaxID=3053502 RepID=UPI002575A4B7|nr:SIR2 family protein [Variovorax sp. J22R24]MDM0110069.1 SIR2 family protein [Variovorax sp. J22R24]